MYALPTIHEFLDNPMGKGSNAITSRKLIKDDLERRYVSLMRRKSKECKTTIYKNKDDYYFHITIPSETERDNTYDVVIQFVLPENNPDTAKNNSSLGTHHVKFFSNSPSFTYTFAYAMNEYGFLISELKKKYRDEVLDKMPTTRNPSEILSYEKSTTFALFHIMHLNYLNKATIDRIAKKYNKDELFKSIREDDKILLEIKKANNKLKSKENDKKAGLANKMRTGVAKATMSSKTSSSSSSKAPRQARDSRAPRAKVKPRAKR